MLKISRISRLPALVAGFFVAFSLVGCGNDPLQKVQVKGVVTFDGGECPESGRVTLSPLEVAEGLPTRPASGSFGPDGKFAAYSFRPGDGVVPGTYQVNVTCFDPTKVSSIPSDAQIRAASYVGKDFEPLTLNVEAGSGTLELNIDVPLGKPRKVKN